MGWLRLYTETIGFWAAVLTTVAFSPQVVRTWRMGGEEISRTMLALFGTGVGLWFLYGYLQMSMPLMLANGLTGLQILIILGLKMRRARHAPRKFSGRESAAPGTSW
jgi:MtN3 and saliva related transmembrane protein